MVVSYLVEAWSQITKISSSGEKAEVAVELVW